MGISQTADYILSCDFGGEAVAVSGALSETAALINAGWVRYRTDNLARQYALAIGDEARAGEVWAGDEPGFAHLDGKVACPVHALEVTRRIAEVRSAPAETGEQA